MHVIAWAEMLEGFSLIALLGASDDVRQYRVVLMSHKLPKELVNQFCEDTPFLAGEVQRLWRRFQALDSAGGGDGTLTLAVRFLRLLSVAAHLLSLTDRTRSSNQGVHIKWEDPALCCRPKLHWLRPYTLAVMMAAFYRAVGAHPSQGAAVQSVYAAHSGALQQ